MKNIFIAIFSAVAVCGCSAYEQAADFNAAHLEDADTSKRLPNLPFQHSWAWEGIDKEKVNAIYVEPVKIDMLDMEKWTSSASAVIRSKEDYLKEAGQVAEYFTSELKSQLEQYPGSKYSLASAPGPGVAVISIALTELEFSHPAAQAGSLVSPIPGTGAALSAVSTPHAAFSARITDAATNQLLATAADRKFPPMRVLDLNKLTISSSVREISKNWSIEIAEAINKGRFAKVESRGELSILPW